MRVRFQCEVVGFFAEFGARFAFCAFCIVREAGRFRFIVLSCGFFGLLFLPQSRGFVV